MARNAGAVSVTRLNVPESVATPSLAIPEGDVTEEKVAVPTGSKFSNAAKVKIVDGLAAKPKLKLIFERSLEKSMVIGPELRFGAQDEL